MNTIYTRDYVVGKVFWHHADGDDTNDGRIVQYLVNYREAAGVVTGVVWGRLWDCLILNQSEGAQIESFIGAGCCLILEVGVDIQA